MGFSTTKKSIYHHRMSLHIKNHLRKYVKVGDILSILGKTYASDFPPFVKVYKIIPDFVYFEGVKGPFITAVLEFTDIKDNFKLIEEMSKAKWKRRNGKICLK